MECQREGVRGEKYVEIETIELGIVDIIVGSWEAPADDLNMNTYIAQGSEGVHGWEGAQGGFWAAGNELLSISFLGT